MKCEKNKNKETFVPMGWFMYGVCSTSLRRWFRCFSAAKFTVSNNKVASEFILRKKKNSVNTKRGDSYSSRSQDESSQQEEDTAVRRLWCPEGNNYAFIIPPIWLRKQVMTVILLMCQHSNTTVTVPILNILIDLFENLCEYLTLNVVFKFVCCEGYLRVFSHQAILASGLTRDFSPPQFPLLVFHYIFWRANMT